MDSRGGGLLLSAGIAVGGGNILGASSNLLGFRPEKTKSVS
jgi:hypothetical protein